MNLKYFFRVSCAIAGLCLCVALTGCDNGNVMPTFKPTGAPSGPTGSKEPTTSPTPEATPTPLPITAVPAATKVDGSDFFEVMRLLGQGTKVETDGAGEEDLARCFFAENLNGAEADVFFGAGFAEGEVADIYRLRVLYYRKNGAVYIGEVYSRKDEAKGVLELFSKAFDEKTQITDLSAGYADEFLNANGFETIDVGSQKREFLYLLPKKDQQ
ncbi:MAG: hypothetical protein J6U10_00205 [Lachnospiraceae bacterium]|nr:hypothetical protein [Lachnospiraceae bacterium]MBP5185076.1 hypothetical protein [Lachnospiraceae bacterium]